HTMIVQQESRPLKPTIRRLAIFLLLLSPQSSVLTKMQNNENGSSCAVRKTMRLIVILVILAWVAQSWFDRTTQGAELPLPTEPPKIPSEQDAGQSTAQEKFVPGSTRFLSGATLELRGEATVVGVEVKLQQVCR